MDEEHYKKLHEMIGKQVGLHPEIVRSIRGGLFGGETKESLLSRANYRLSHKMNPSRTELFTTIKNFLLTCTDQQWLDITKIYK